MGRKIILILGDSTSMSVGVERAMYPFHLAARKTWAPGARIVNSSLPGFTSADACAFYFNHRHRLWDLGAVVVYLGNCDTIASELRKGRYTRLRHWWERATSLLVRKSPKTRLKNRLLHFEWNPDFDATLEKPESPDDYAFNIGRILYDCGRRGIPAILIRPEAHLAFPAGLGKGNFLFYKCLGLDERIADRLKIEDERFKAALKLHEDGNLAAALDAYRDILREPGPLSGQLEYPTMVVHNYAACAAQAGALDEAEYLLRLLLKERNARKEIVFYNLARLAELRGDAAGSESLVAEAYEADCSMYRVRDPYKRAVDQLAEEYPGVHAIDLRGLVRDEQYVDHCHPLPEAQGAIADAVLERLLAFGLGGDQSLEIENILYNPEYGIGNHQEFYEYFRTYAPFTEDEIREFVSSLRRAPSDVSGLESLPVEIRTAFEYYARHPLFSDRRDAVEAGPSCPSDVGRFPEYFIVRALIPYLRVLEESPEIPALFSPESGLLRSSEALRSILPPRAVDWIEAELRLQDPERERARLARILDAVRTRLTDHLRAGPRIHERLKTTIYWYFRETLRFGSHSRHSMRYDRVALEYLAEALAVAAVLDMKTKANRNGDIRRWAGLLEKTTLVHESYCRRFSSVRDGGGLMKDYGRELADILGEATSSPEGRPLQTGEIGQCAS